MKNLKKTELTVIALTLLCLVFTAGYFIGRGSSVRVISFEKLSQVSASAHTDTPSNPVPVTGAAAPASASMAGVTAQATYSPGTPSGEPSVSAGAPSPVQSDKININTASQAKLEELPGIGPVLARSIIDYRQRNGGFSSIEQIMDIDGIGEKKFIAMKDMITVGKE